MGFKPGADNIFLTAPRRHQPPVLLLEMVTLRIYVLSRCVLFTSGRPSDHWASIRRLSISYVVRSCVGNYQRVQAEPDSCLVFRALDAKDMPHVAGK